MTIEERLAGLERRNWKLTLGLVLTAIAAGVVAVAGAGAPGAVPRNQFGDTILEPAPADVIRARKFELVDENFRVRAVIEARKDGGGRMVLFGGPTPVPARVVIEVTKDSGAGIHLYGENSRGGGGLMATKDGTSLALFNEDGGEGAILMLNKGKPSLDLFDENGKERVALMLDKDAAALRLLDERGKVRVDLPLNEDGAAFRLLDGHGKMRAGFGLLNNVGPSLVLFDENGRTLGTLP